AGETGPAGSNSGRSHRFWLSRPRPCHRPAAYRGPPSLLRGTGLKMALPSFARSGPVLSNRTMKKNARATCLHFALIGLVALAVLAHGLPYDVARHGTARAEGRLDPQIGCARSATAANGMVVAQEAIAARVGADILQKGGNAIDAAVAT